MATQVVQLRRRGWGETMRPDPWWIQPLVDTETRADELREAHGIGYCNITKCCTKVRPESITITDNAIIPLKERVVDEHYDPLTALVRLFRRKS